MELAGSAAVFDKVIVAVAVEVVALHDRRRNEGQIVEPAVDGVLPAVRPGLVAVQIEHIAPVKGIGEHGADVVKPRLGLRVQRQGKALVAVLHRPAQAVGFPALGKGRLQPGFVFKPKPDLPQSHAADSPSVWMILSSVMRERMRFSP